MRILVGDDSGISRKFFRNELESGGYEVVEAASETDGLEQFTALKPDLVTLGVGIYQWFSWSDSVHGNLPKGLKGNNPQRNGE